MALLFYGSRSEFRNFDLAKVARWTMDYQLKYPHNFQPNESQEYN